MPTPDIVNISTLETGFYFPSFYSNKNLINPFYITNLWYSELKFYEPNFLSGQPKIPRYKELKALNIAESKLKI